MKKTLLLFSAVLLAAVVFGQQNLRFRDNLKDAKAPFVVKTSDNSGNDAAIKYVPVARPEFKSGDADLILRNIGGSGNAFGFLGTRQYLWVDNNINSVSFVHRMLNPPGGPGSSFLAYDYSTNHGEAWTVNAQVYEPLSGATSNARYPHGAIYNPAGNTNPANAYFGYFASMLDASNGGTWGGYCFGTHKFGSAQAATQHTTTTVGDILQGVPSAYEISSLGRAICADPAKVGTTAPYTDLMILTTGMFNPATEDFDMEQILVEMPGNGVSPTGTFAGVADTKVAFSPDGQIGYIVYLSNNDENTIESSGCYFPIIYKSTDGGENWEGPYNVQLGGFDGIPAVLNYLPDAIIEQFFEPPLPAREDIPFTAAFELGLSVDFNGNPHLLFEIGIGSQDWSIYSSYGGNTGCAGCVAMMHIYSPNGGTNWIGDTICTVKTFRGEFPYTGGDPVAVDNRPYIASTPDGTKMFFSWIDTDIPGVGDNLQPDIYCVGYDVVNNTYSQLYNVTAFSAAMWTAYMGAGSKHVFDNGNGTYTVPFVYQEINPNDLIDPVQFVYVDNFVLSDADLQVTVGCNELQTLNFDVSQNFPNPSGNETRFTVNLSEPGTINYEVTNILGQLIWKGTPVSAPQGTQVISINTRNLQPGIYFYNVRVGENVITKKMVIE